MDLCRARQLPHQRVRSKLLTRSSRQQDSLQRLIRLMHHIQHCEKTRSKTQ